MILRRSATCAHALTARLGLHKHGQNRAAFTTMKHYSRSPPGTPGKRRSALLGGIRHRPTSPSSPVNRTYTAVPAGASRGGEPLGAGEAVVAVTADRRSGDVEPEEWVKVSWKKGECRDEIKLVAEAAGLGFDAAQIVVRLHDINHPPNSPTNSRRNSLADAQLQNECVRARRCPCETRTQDSLALRCSFPGVAGSTRLSRGARLEVYGLRVMHRHQTSCRALTICGGRTLYAGGCCG